MNRLGIVYICLLVAVGLFYSGCQKDPSNDGGEQVETFTAKAPAFDAERAYGFIEKQLSFGPRVPNSAGHAACAAWMVDTLKSFGANVEIQRGEVEAFDGTKLKIQNIIGSFNPQAVNRIMISAHWDTRPFADQDADTTLKNTPIPGANDGGSGVAVMLEMARIIGQDSLNVGVDFFFWDAEDYGDSETSNSYCLGTQYWAKNMPNPNYRPNYGINLDMVGAKGAVFTQDQVSVVYASHVLKKVWDIGHLLGYSSYFVYRKDSPLIDDHVYVNQLANIPMIDIIDRTAAGGKFFDHWHTMKDDIDAISKETLKAVGQTVLETIYQEE